MDLSPFPDEGASPENTSALVDLLRNKFKQYTSLDTPKNESLGDTGAQMAMGMVPVLGQAMALRDMERARRDSDPVAGGLAAASLVPWGKVVGALRGEKAAAGPVNQIIGGYNAKKAPIDDLTIGRDALMSGETPGIVWQRHGVYEGLENHSPMKFEIPDQQSMIRTKGSNWADVSGGREYRGPAHELLDHPELWENYPQLKDLAVELRMGPKTGNRGSHTESWIDMHGKERPAKIEASVQTPELGRNLMLHEIMHGVQGIEGFEKGGSPDRILSVLLKRYPQFTGDQLKPKAVEMYKRMMGEVEPRTVQNRLYMNDLSRFPLSSAGGMDTEIAKQLRREQVPGYK